jgi:hypothetical protein
MGWHILADASCRKLSDNQRDCSKRMRGTAGWQALLLG